jgi:hypothetical protein
VTTGHYYGVVELIKDGDFGTKTVLKEDYAELKRYMKDFLLFDSLKRNQIKLTIC